MASVRRSVGDRINDAMGLLFWPAFVLMSLVPWVLVGR